MREGTGTNDILRHVPGRFGRVSSTYGGEWAGPCPWCGGRDRFRVWPHREASEIVYWCRGCGESGDLIQFVRDQKGLSFQEACVVAGQAPRGKGKGKVIDLLKARSFGALPLEPEQLTMLEALTLISARMQQALARPSPQAYLAFRGVPLEVAYAEGVGYLPALTEENRTVYDAHRVLRMWEDSLVIPTPSPWGMSYTARSLRLWKPGMDEEEHKQVLTEAKLPRVMKTGNAGWMWRPKEVGRVCLLVEGAFEKLALCAAGWPAHHIISVGTNAANVDWLPPHITAVVVAFNGDERGQAGARRLCAELRFAGIQVVECFPPADGRGGKDWSARWRTLGYAGLWDLFEAWHAVLASYEEPGAHCLCGRDVEYYSSRGVPYCEEHWRTYLAQQPNRADVDQENGVKANTVAEVMS